MKSVKYALNDSVREYVFNLRLLKMKSVKDKIVNQVRSQIDHQVWNQVCHKIIIQLLSQIDDQVYYQVRNRVINHEIR